MKAPKTKVCSKCGKRKKLDAFRKQMLSLGLYTHTECKACSYIRFKKYSSTPKRKAELAVYRATPKYKAAIARYLSTPEGKAACKRKRQHYYYSLKGKKYWAHKRASLSYKKDARERAKRNADALVPGYVAYVMGKPVSQVPPALIEAKREAIKIHRLILQTEQRI